MKSLAAALVAPLLVAAPMAAAEPLRADQAAFRELYKTMVETDTSITTGSCTLLADRIEAHMKAHGFTDGEITRFAVPEHPKEGGIVVVMPGTDPKAKAILLLGHLDVVTARRADWTRDPYTLIEENGYFYGRGTQDMKAMDAIWVDMLERFRTGKVKLRRTIKLALTCGEETTTAFNGARWLAENRPELIAAEFALNEGGGGRSDGQKPGGGTIVVANLHVGEKMVGEFRIEATNPGGHSSAPVRDNAIYELADALARLRDLEFPVMLTDTTRAYFAKSGAIRQDETGAAMRTVSSATPGSPEFVAAVAVLDKDKSFHSMLRTTCVATLLDGGHASNALPQRAGAVVNCRIFPGVGMDEVQAALVAAIADPRMTVTALPRRGPTAKAPPLDPKIVGPAEKLVARYYPGTPLVPLMSTGATDGIFLEAIGIPSYGPPGLYGDPDGMGTHGLNERAMVKAVYSGRDLLTELVTTYANAK